MTSNHERATTLVRALHAAIDRDRQALQDTLTDDVRAWSPALATASRAELLEELDRRDDSVRRRRAPRHGPRRRR